MQIQDLITLYEAETAYHTLNKRSVLSSFPFQTALICIAVSAPYKPVSHLPSLRHMLNPYFCWFSSVLGNHIQSKSKSNRAPHSKTANCRHCCQQTLSQSASEISRPSSQLVNYFPPPMFHKFPIRNQSFNSVSG